eukprot:174309-Amphidinium_carterae.2
MDLHQHLSTPQGFACDYFHQLLHKIYSLPIASTQGAAHTHSCGHSKADTVIGSALVTRFHVHPHNLHCHVTSSSFTLGHLKNLTT